MNLKYRELQVKIEPHSSSMRYYCIYYRYRKRFNLFNFWKQLVEVHDGFYLNYSQPVMFSDFDAAVAYGEQLKANPSLIDEHYAREDKRYQAALQRSRAEYNSRNRTKIL